MLLGGVHEIEFAPYDFATKRYPRGRYNVGSGTHERSAEGKKFLETGTLEAPVEIAVKADRGEGLQLEIDKRIHAVRVAVFRFVLPAPITMPEYGFRITSLFTPVEHPRVDPGGATEALIRVPIIIDYQLTWHQQPTTN